LRQSTQLTIERQNGSRVTEVDYTAPNKAIEEERQGKGSRNFISRGYSFILPGIHSVMRNLKIFPKLSTNIKT
jgi:hypothetical protein